MTTTMQHDIKVGDKFELEEEELEVVEFNFERVLAENGEGECFIIPASFIKNLNFITHKITISRSAAEVINGIKVEWHKIRTGFHAK